MHLSEPRDRLMCHRPIWTFLTYVATKSFDPLAGSFRAYREYQNDSLRRLRGNRDTDFFQLNNQTNSILSVRRLACP